MRATPTLLAIGLAGVIALATTTGCRTPPPPRVQIPVDSRGNEYTTHQHDPAKPMPPSASQQSSNDAQPTDRVLVIPPATKAPAYSQAYLESYDRVGRPRLLVVVDRSDAQARSLVPGDYDTLEKVVRDALAADGQVLVVPAGVAHQLNEQQVKGMAAGDTKTLAGVGNQLHADVIVTVHAGPNAKEREETDLTATARNARDGMQIATVTSSIPPPPQRRQIDFAGRLLAERLVDELASAWENLSRIPAAPPTTQPKPATQPDRAGLTG